MTEIQPELKPVQKQMLQNWCDTPKGKYILETMKHHSKENYWLLLPTQIIVDIIDSEKRTCNNIYPDIYKKINNYIDELRKDKSIN